MHLHIILVLSVICYTNCVLYSINVSKGPTEKDWKQFKLAFNKTYQTKEEGQRRHKIFKQNWKSIQKHNKRYAKAQETYLQEVNIFSDLTEKEFSDRYKLFENSNLIVYSQDNTLKNTTTDNVETDENWDWREAGAVTPVQDQGPSVASWVFSTVGHLEGYHYQKTKNLLDLSEQHIIDCYTNTSSSGLSNLDVVTGALYFVKENGIHLDTNYPYTSQQNNCKIIVPPVYIYFDNVHLTNGSDDDLKDVIKNQGPVVVCVYATSKWMFYSSGIWYNNKCSTEVNHCLLVVGYGTENGTDYWLFKNSWGSQWGLDGFMKFARINGTNYCGTQSGLYIQ